MKTEMLSTRIDRDTKSAFTHICDAIGLSPSQAITLYVKAVINHGGIPFDLKTKQANNQTLAAIQELEKGDAHTISDLNQLIKESRKH